MYVKSKTCSYVHYHAAAPYNATITETVDNSNVTYICHADGGLDNTYEWLRLRDNEVVSLTQELILDNRNPLDGGDYECTVTNTAGNTSVMTTHNSEITYTRLSTLCIYVESYCYLYSILLTKNIPLIYIYKMNKKLKI